jgi:hypothetical protein
MRYALLLALLLARPAFATETIALQGRAIGAPAGDCLVYRWDSDVLFHNRADAPAAVHLIGVSNGGPALPALVEFTIAANQSTTLALQNAHWAPAASPLWVVRFDAPESVTTESRMSVGYNTPCVVGSPPVGAGAFGKVSFPIYRALQPAGVPKVHLGTDAAFVASRVNVAVYNAGIATAAVHVELRQVCDDRLVTARDVMVESDTVVQIGGLSNSTQCTTNAAFASMTYVTVTADQPSASWVSVLPTSEQIRATYAVSISSP